MDELLTLPNAVAAVIGLSLNAYVLLGGADFGGGVWDLAARGPRREAQRDLITNAIGPIWEANHVWLILVIVLLFTCFPPVFADLSIALHIPLVLMLIGIVLRGSAFVFRSYGRHAGAAARRWGGVFSVASVITPVLLGVTVGAIVSGAVATRGHEHFAEAFIDPWLTPFAFGVGLMALALFAFLAAVYLTLEAEDEDLREDFRRRALVGAAAVFVTAWAVLLLSRGVDSLVGHRLVSAAWAIPFHVLTGAAAVTAIAALWTRRYRLARIAAALQVSLILWGWLIAQYPYLVPPEMTIADTAAPTVTLVLILIGLAVGFLILIPSLYYLFRVFHKVGVVERERPTS